MQVIAQRVGGAFGSKATQATRTSVSAAVCAAKLGADVTIALDRDTDIHNRERKAEGERGREDAYKKR